MASLLRTMGREAVRVSRNGVLRDGYLVYRAKERSAGRPVLNKRDWIVKGRKK